MAQIASIDWEAKRFYLHADTVTNGFDAWEAFAEVRALQAVNANGEQGYRLFLQREGKTPKGGGRFTPRFVSFLPGWRAVPYDQAAHTLDLLVEMVSADEVSDRDMFDRSGVAVNVDIDPVYSQVEIIERGSGLDGTQAAQLAQAALDARLSVEHHEGRFPTVIDEAAQVLIQYDKDGSTELRRIPIVDKAGAAVVVPAGALAGRGVPVDTP